MTTARDFAPYDTATLFEAAGKEGAMSVEIKPSWAGAELVGQALTVKTPAGDNLALHHAITLAEPSTVLVVDGGGHLDTALWGDVMAVAAQARAISGIVVDGAVRDVNAMKAIGFAAFSKGIAIAGPSKDAYGQIGNPVTCGGTAVHTGDWIVGDENGVVVIPEASAALTLEAANKRSDFETQMRQRLSGGLSTTIEELNLAAKIPMQRSC